MAKEFVCPNCGGKIIRGQYGYYCENKCGLIMGKLYGKKLSDSEIEDLLEGKEILVKNLESKAKNTKYDVYAKLNGTETVEDKIYLHFDTHFPEDAPIGVKCPNCGGDIVKGKFIHCKNECGIRLRKAYGKDLTEDQIKQLLKGKEVLVKGFVSKTKNTEYDMYLKMNGTEEYNGSIYIKYDTRFPDNDQ